MNPLSSMRALQPYIALLFLLLTACSSDPVMKRSNLERASDPSGTRSKVLENRLHKVHLEGTTPLRCAECHDMSAASFEIPGPKTCVGCHAPNETMLHGEELPCTECHSFADEQDEKTGDSVGVEPTPIATTVLAPSDCLRCHTEEQGKHKPVKAHAKVQCDTCHRAHAKESLSVDNCLNCHEDHQSNHGEAQLSTLERCLQCHPPHTASIEAVALCQDCHKEKLVSAVFRGHNKCDTCHLGDRQSAPKHPKSCQSCHDDRITLAATTVKEHAKCENCHAPHDPGGTAIQSCRRCHSSMLPKHPAEPKKGRCIGCHDAHPKVAEAGLVSCSSCHKNARTDSALHAPGETTCVQCHRPHKAKTADCQSCHEKQTRLAAPIAEHSKCESCHRKPHQPKLALPTCGSCHTSEYDTAPAGHRDCASCHEPHEGKVLAAARCESCHKEQAQQTHSRVEGGCESCHRAHGPGGRAKVPSCTTCHSANKLPALHAFEDHRECSTCHQGHGKKVLDRKSCLGCHEKEVDHEPVAKTCIGCHPFGASR